MPRGGAEGAPAGALDDVPTESSSDEEPAAGSSSMSYASSPFKALSTVRPVEGKQLRVFGRGQWKQALVLEASEGGARVRLPGPQTAGSSQIDYKSGDDAWVDVRDLGDGMIAGFERISAPVRSHSTGLTPTNAAERLERAGRIADNLRAAQSARAKADSARKYRVSTQSPPQKIATSAAGSPPRPTAGHTADQPAWRSAGVVAGQGAMVQRDSTLGAAPARPGSPESSPGHDEWVQPSRQSPSRQSPSRQSPSRRSPSPSWRPSRSPTPEPKPEPTLQLEPEPEPEPEPEHKDNDTRENDEDEDVEADASHVIGWCSVVGFLAFIIFALMYFIDGSPTVAKPVEHDLDCERDPDCGSTAFDEPEEDAQSEHFHRFSSDAKQFGFGLVIAGMFIICGAVSCCACHKRKRDKLEEGYALADSDESTYAAEEGCCNCEELSSTSRPYLYALTGAGVIVLVVQYLNRDLTEQVAKMIAPGLDAESAGIQFLLLTAILTGLFFASIVISKACHTCLMDDAYESVKDEESFGAGDEESQVTQSPAPDADNIAVGSKLDVYSKSAGNWVQGTVQAVSEDGGLITIGYYLRDGQAREKKVKRGATGTWRHVADVLEASPEARTEEHPLLDEDASPPRTHEEVREQQLDIEVGHVHQQEAALSPRQVDRAQVGAEREATFSREINETAELQQKMQDALRVELEAQKSAAQVAERKANELRAELAEARTPSASRASADDSVEVTELRSEKEREEGLRKDAEEHARAEAAQRKKLQDEFDALLATQKASEQQSAGLEKKIRDEAEARKVAEEKAAQFEKEVSEARASADDSVEVTELRSEKEKEEGLRKDAEERARAEAAQRKKLQDEFDALLATQKADAEARKVAEEQAESQQKAFAQARQMLMQTVSTGEPVAVGPAVKYMVLASATVRDGPESSSNKLGEHQKGDVIEVVAEQKNSDGLEVLKTTTAPAGSASGGWVKMKTSKGKLLLERISGDSKTYSAKWGSKKVHLQAGPMGLQVLAPGVAPETLLYAQLYSWEPDDGNDILVVTRAKLAAAGESKERLLGEKEEFKISPAGEDLPSEIAEAMNIESGQLASEMKKQEKLKLEQGLEEDASQLSGIVLKAAEHAMVRQTFELDSEEVFTLHKGECIEVLEARLTDSGTMRIRFEKGWTSTKARNGMRLLRRASEKEKEKFAAQATAAQAQLSDRPPSPTAAAKEAVLLEGNREFVCGKQTLNVGGQGIQVSHKKANDLARVS
jgi:hypothetical protein